MNPLTKKQKATIEKRLKKCYGCGKPAACKCDCGFLTCRNTHCYGPHERACPHPNEWHSI